MDSFKVIRLHSENGHRVSRVEDTRLDELDPGDVVIRSQYAAVNYKDARAVTGAGNVVKRFPCIPGIEVGGIVAASKSPKFREGDVVTVQGGPEFGIRHDGAYSEYVRVPAEWVHPVTGGFDSFSVVALGIAAYTAAVAVEELIAHGVSPDKGKVAVTGATGGCASFVIDMLAGLGFNVVAVSGKPLDDLLRTMKKRGVVCAYGNAAGETFTTSIYPFILRSVQLVGVNANHPVSLRGGAWGRLAGDLRPRNLDRIVTRVPFAGLPAYCERVIAGGIRGRGVVQF